MAAGTVKWFNETSGYGFITPDQGGDDLYVRLRLPRHWRSAAGIPRMLSSLWC